REEWEITLLSTVAGRFNAPPELTGCRPRNQTPRMRALVLSLRWRLLPLPKPTRQRFRVYISPDGGCSFRIPMPNGRIAIESIKPPGIAFGDIQTAESDVCAPT